MSKLAKYLNRHILGNVFERPEILQAYDSDRSVLQYTPRFVALPETADDVRRLARFANQLAKRGFSLPITVRGSGLDKTGAAIGDGLVISMERLNRIEEIDVRGRLVRVQPGITLGSLNAALALQGLTLPIAAHPDMTIGGLIANCLGDDLSGRHGGIFHYVEQAEVVLASGDIVQLLPYSQRAIIAKQQTSSVEGTLYRKIEHLLEQHGDTVMERTMRPFDTAGYANITRVRQGNSINLLPLMFASQGTLGVITDVILRVNLSTPDRRSLVTVFKDLKDALRFLEQSRELDPAFIRIYDLRIIGTATEQGNRPELLEQAPDAGWLLEIGFDFYKWKTMRRMQQCLELLPPDAFIVQETDDNSAEFREFRNALLSFLNAESDFSTGARIAVLDDVYIPSYKLIEFVQNLRLLEETLDLSLPLFGSLITSNYSVRPIIDLTALEGRQLLLKFLQQYSRLVVQHGGSLTGGSPEGRIKFISGVSALSEAEEQLYRELKAIFDPQNILNPGVKLSADTKDVVRHLRTTPRLGLITP